MIKTFRGILTYDVEERIRLQTIKGKTGYRIIKFAILPEAPITSDIEAIVQIWKRPAGTMGATVNFTDSDMIAVGVWWGGGVGTDDPQDWIQIFDREIFNQDIFIGQYTSGGTFKINYYLELEVVPLDDAGAEYTTLKDMR